MAAAFRGVAPSILSADFARLGAQVQEVLDAGASTIHVDIMDGHFGPPITMGPLVVDALAEIVHGAGGVIDVHMMVERPERYVEDFASAGADGITLHVEATRTCTTRSPRSGRRAAARAWLSARARRWARWRSWSRTSTSCCA